MRRAEESVEIETVDASFALGTRGSVVMMVWRGEATRDRLTSASALIARHARARGTNVAVLSVIERGAVPPGDSELAELGVQMRELAPAISAAAFVLEAGGAEGEHVLSIGLELDELRDVPLTHKYCFDPSEAAAWIARRCEVEALDVPARDELVGGVERLRAEIDRCARARGV